MPIFDLNLQVSPGRNAGHGLSEGYSLLFAGSSSG